MPLDWSFVVYVIIMSLSGLFGVYIGTELSWRKGRKTTEGLLDKLLEKLLGSEQARQVSDLLKQLNDFSHSPEGKELIGDMKSLVQDLRNIAQQLVKEGIAITPKESLIQLPERPKLKKEEARSEWHE